MNFKFKHLIAAAALLTGVSACDDITELDLLDDPNQVSPDQAGAEFLYNSIQLKFAEVYMGQASNDLGNSLAAADGGTTPNLFRFASDLTRMTALTGGATYLNAFQPVYFNALWTDVYADMFPDIDALATIAAERGLSHHIGTARIMKAYTMMMLVDIFGEVPYSEIGQGIAEISPKLDDGASVYAEAIALLDQGIEDLGDEDAPEIGDGDNFYGGDTDNWITLANTLKFRAAVTTRLADANAASDAQTILDGGDLISESGSDWEWTYGSSRTNPSTRHPLYVDWYESMDGDYLGNYFMWVVAEEKSLVDEDVTDPRALYYFYRQETSLAAEIVDESNAFDCILSAVPDRDAAPDHYLAVDPNMPYCLGTAMDEIGETGYFGRDHGNNSGIPPDGDLRTVFGVYPAGGLYDDGSGQVVQEGGTLGATGEGIIPFMLESYVHFLRAEAALTMGTSDDAKAQLEAGIRASMDKVSGFAGSPAIADSVVTEYVEFVMDAYDTTDDAGKLAIIGKEHYIALWGTPFEHYNLYRRTCAPTNMQPLLENPQDGPNFIQSALYPTVFVTLNQDVDQKSVTDEVFWDTNGPGCNY